MSGIGLRDIVCSLGTARIKWLKFLDFCCGRLLAAVVPQRKAALPTDGTVRDILVIRPGGLGDAIFLLPILRAIKAQYPAVNIDILGERRNIQAFVSRRDICRTLFCYDDRRQLAEVRQRAYDVVIDTEQWHYLSAFVAWQIRARYRVGFETAPGRKKFFDRTVTCVIDRYELLNFLDLFAVVFPLPTPPENINDSFQVSAETVAWAAREVPPGSVTLFLGASIPLRRFSRSQSAEIARDLTGRNIPVVLLGGADIREEATSLAAEVRSPLLYNFAGKASLEETAALIKHSRCFIGNDSGVLHLACAVGTPTVAVFGPGNMEKWYPRGSRHRVVSRKLPCSPCTRFGYTVPVCGKKYPCMRGLIVKEILDALK